MSCNTTIRFNRVPVSGGTATEAQIGEDEVSVLVTEEEIDVDDQERLDVSGGTRRTTRSAGPVTGPAFRREEPES